MFVLLILAYGKLNVKSGYVGMLSMATTMNICVIDMTHMVARHANVSHKEDTIRFGKGDDGKKFHPFEGC